jgi:ADP-ribosylglycohydrolase
LFFTDDSVLTIAVANALLQDGDFAEQIWQFGNRYPGRGYEQFYGVVIRFKKRTLSQFWERFGYARQPGRLGI